VSTESKYIEAISANVANTRFEDFDQATIDLAKNRVIDVLGCLIGGANAPGNPALLKLVKRWGGKREATILVHGGKAPAQTVAMLNTIMARSFDFEVMSYVHEGKYIPSHHAATLVPTAIALSESCGASGKELLTAMLVGDDTPARVQAASAGHPIGLGWDGCGTLSHLGATATASRLMGLNPYQTRMAFGIVLNTIASAIQSLWDGATTFKLGQGAAARNGIFSAELAKEGWTGVDDALLSRFGYFFLYGGGCKDPEILTKDLGKKYYGEAYFKPYPSGLPTHNGIDAALAILSKHDIDSENIEAININLPKGTIGRSYYAKPFELRGFPHADAIFSNPYTICSTLVLKSCNLYNFTDEALHNPRIVGLTRKTNLIEKDEIKGGLNLEVKMKNGEVFSETGQMRTAWMKEPTPRAEIETKFWHQVEYSKTISQAKAKKLLKLLEKLEEQKGIGEIVELLTKGK
ncbi:MAG TPA: MmgE/PrpD family protein, partial [Dehalococcoidales bacterium]